MNGPIDVASTFFVSVLKQTNKKKDWIMMTGVDVVAGFNELNFALWENKRWI